MFLGLILSPLFMFAQDFNGLSTEMTYVECTAYDQLGEKFIIHSAYSDGLTVEEWFDGDGNSFFKYAFFHTSTHPDDFDDSTLKILNDYGVTSYYITPNRNGVSICSTKYRLINIKVSGESTYTFTIVNLKSNESFKIELTLVDCKALEEDQFYKESNKL